MASSHPERVQTVAAQVKARPPGSRVTIRKATPSHSIRDAAYKTSCHPVDVSASRVRTTYRAFSSRQEYLSCACLISGLR